MPKAPKPEVKSSVIRPLKLLDRAHALRRDLAVGSHFGHAGLAEQVEQFVQRRFLPPGKFLGEALKRFYQRLV